MRFGYNNRRCNNNSNKRTSVNNSNITQADNIELTMQSMDKKDSNTYIEYRDSFTAEGPVQGRKYTITHSDTTGDLFVTVGNDYAEDKIDQKMRDEVRLKWIKSLKRPALIGTVFLDGDDMKRDVIKRKEIFVKEMPTALKGLRKVEDTLFQMNPCLDKAQVIIGFESSNPMYQGWHSFGVIGDYVE